MKKHAWLFAAACTVLITAAPALAAGSGGSSASAEGDAFVLLGIVLLLFAMWRLWRKERKARKRHDSRRPPHRRP